jgi:hypothetical protein
MCIRDSVGSEMCIRDRTRIIASGGLRAKRGMESLSYRPTKDDSEN